MEEVQYGEALKKLAMALGLKTLEGLTGQLEPDALLRRANETLETELRGALKELLQDVSAAPLQGLIDRLFEELDGDKIISALAGPLAADLAEWFKQEEADYLAKAVVNALDMEEVKHLVAARVADRVTFAGGQAQMG